MFLFPPCSAKPPEYSKTHTLLQTEVDTWHMHLCLGSTVRSLNRYLLRWLYLALLILRRKDTASVPAMLSAQWTDRYSDMVR